MTPEQKYILEAVARVRGEYHSLCIEMKTHRKGSGQSDKQIEWEQVAEENGNKYVVCRDLEEFKITVLNYLFP